MKWLSTRTAAWVVGAVAGIAVGTPVAMQTQAWQESREESDRAQRLAVFESRDDVPRPVDTVRELLAQDTRVVIDPLLEGRIPDADRERAEAMLADSPVPARIAYVSYPDRTEVGYTPSGLGPQWWTNVGEEGHYVVLWDNGSARAGAVGLEAEHVWARTEGQPGPALIRIAEEMVTWEAEPLPTVPAEPSDSDPWGGVAGGLALTGVLGAVAVVPLFFLLRFLVGMQRRKVA